MKFTKIIYFIFFNLFIFNNIYADTAKSENKCNAQNDYLNNQDNKYYQEFNTSNCEDIKLSNPTKYIFCKLKNNNRAVAIAPALPWIIEGVKDLTIATGAAMASSALLKGDTNKCGPCKQGSLVANPGSKVNWRLDEPGKHSHYDCPKEAGHWHYEILNQNPNTCDCKANKSGRFYFCGTDTPTEYNTIKWKN